MREQLTIMTRKGQITVPAEVRRALGLRIGDKVAVSLEEEEGALHATLRPAHSVADMTFGAIKVRQRPKGNEVSRQAFIEHAAERDERTRNS